MDEKEIAMKFVLERADNIAIFRLFRNKKYRISYIKVIRIKFQYKIYSEPFISSSFSTLNLQRSHSSVVKGPDSNALH